MRFLSLLLYLFSCSSMATEQLVFWYHNYELRTSIATLQQRFEDETGIRLETQHMPVDDLRTAAKKSIHSATTPDILFAPSDFIGNRNALQLSSVPLAWNQGVTQLARDSVTVRQQQFGVPILFGNHLMLYYNKQLVAQPAASWQQLLAQKQQLNKLDNKIQLIGWKPKEMYWAVPFLTSYGGQPVDDTKVTLATEELRKGLVFYREQIAAAGVAPDCSYECVYQHFIDGDYAYSINGDWAYHSFTKALGNKLGVALLPSVEGQPMRSMSSSVALLFPGNALSGKNSPAIQQFVAFMQRSDNQLLLHQSASMIPADQAAYQIVLEQKQQDQNYRAMLQQLEQSIAMPPTAAMSAAWIGMAKGVEVYMNGNTDAAKAVKLMQLHAEREMQRQNRLARE